jgi:mannose-6-phosphate isomerase-like protein (cupin superfamily)
MAMERETMSENHSTSANALALALAENMFLLQADGVVTALPWSHWRPGSPGWMIGLRRFNDDHSVHAEQWERHPSGDEILCLIEGQLQIWLQTRDGECSLHLQAGNGLCVPRDTWHRMRVHKPGQLIFITPGGGSERRPVAA